ncbi:MAG: hypothetical protein J2P31_18030, partial [Blastocatellia bacterium]|nr:hypothetical protein [Blastocatellia bacterium]
VREAGGDDGAVTGVGWQANQRARIASDMVGQEPSEAIRRKAAPSRSKDDIEALEKRVAAIRKRRSSLYSERFRRTTVNGIGERADNAALEEIVLAMKVTKNVLRYSHVWDGSLGQQGGRQWHR